MLRAAPLILIGAASAAPAPADFFDDVRRTFQKDTPRTFEQDIPRFFGAKPKAEPATSPPKTRAKPTLDAPRR